MEFELSAGEKKILLRTAREAIASKLEQREAEYPEPSKTLKKKCGAFDNRGSGPFQRLQ